MLSLQERRRVLAFLGYFCKLNLLPLDVDGHTGEVRQRAGTAWKGWIPLMSFALFTAHAFYKTRLYALFCTSDRIQLHHHIAMTHALLAALSGSFLVHVRRSVHSGDGCEREVHANDRDRKNWYDNFKTDAACFIMSIDIITLLSNCVIHASN